MAPARTGTFEEAEDFVTVKLDEQVLHIPRRTVVGKLVQTDTEFLTIMRGDQRITIPRVAVERLEVSRSRSTRASHTIYGTLIGAGALATLLSGVDYVGAFGGVVVGAPHGAVVGFATGKGEKWEETSADKVRVSLTPIPRGLGVSVAVRF